MAKFAFAFFTGFLVLFCCSSLCASTIGLTAARGFLSADGCGSGPPEKVGSLPISSSTLTSSFQLPCDYSSYTTFPPHDVYADGYTFASGQIVGIIQENMNNAPCTALPCETPAVGVQAEVAFTGPPWWVVLFSGLAALEYSVAIDQTSSPPVPVTTVPVAVYFQTETQGNDSHAYGWVIGPSGKQDLPQNTPLSVQVPVGTAYAAYEEVGCDAGGGDTTLSPSCLAMADPAFEFDQAAFDAEMEAQGLTPFPLSDYFKFQYSPNLTTIPEPSSLILCATGLLIFAAFLRRRFGRPG